MVDIHSRAKNLDRNTDKYISKLYPEDREDARRFIDELLAQGYSAGRVDKYLSSLVSISRMRVEKLEKTVLELKSEISEICKEPPEKNEKGKAGLLSD